MFKYKHSVLPFCRMTANVIYFNIQASDIVEFIFQFCYLWVREEIHYVSCIDNYKYVYT